MKSVWRLEITREIRGETLILALRGRLGASSAGDFIEAVVPAVNEGHRTILVDLEQVDYMSSRGLMAVDALAGRVRLAGGNLVLCAACDPVRLVLEFGGVLADVPLEPSRESALERLRPRTAETPGSSS